MSAIHVMAFDLGASNGRGIVATYDKGKIELTEVHRFSNDPVKLNNYLYWDFPRLFHELKIALMSAKNMGFNIQSLGIDTWGVDYGLIDKDGELIGNPIHYRDERAAKGMAILLSKYDKTDLKIRTGMDLVSYNTVNQLMADKQLNNKASRENIDTLLNMPDLFNYFLTDIKASEFSMVSTSQLYDYKSMDWNFDLINELNLPVNIFGKVISSGQIVGQVKQEILDECKISPLKVVSVTSHDTAAAIRAVPTDDDDYLFIATGTWVIVGAKQKNVTMNDQVLKYDLTNEGGKYPFINLLKNHVGLWMLQESKKHWEKSGMTISFSEMVDQGEAAECDSFIDIMDSRFFEPGDMPLKVKAYCQETGQEIPETLGQVVLVIEQSLAKQIAKTLNDIEEAVGKTYTKVHIFGGGVKDRLLCQLIYKYSGKEVVIGPKEATALGNVVDQFIALEVFDESDRIKVLMNSTV